MAPAGFKLHLRLNLGEIGSETIATRNIHNAHFRHRDGSWATVHSDDYGSTWVATEGGPRKLWIEIEALHHQWRELGEPGLDDYRITLTAKALYISLEGFSA